MEIERYMSSSDEASYAMIAVKHGDGVLRYSDGSIEVCVREGESTCWCSAASSRQLPSVDGSDDEGDNYNDQRLISPPGVCLFFF